MPHDTEEQDLLADEAVDRVRRWLDSGERLTTRAERKAARRLGEAVADESGAAFAMRFVDRVARPESRSTAAEQLASLVGDADLPSFLAPTDRLLLRVGARLGLRMPRVVMPLAERRMRAIVGPLVIDSEPQELAAHLRSRSSDGFSLNVNLLGEAVLGDAEAARRAQEVLALIAQPDVDYVSVKVSSVVAQLNPWDFDGSVLRVGEALRPLFLAAASSSPPTFINLDMEEYRDLELTLRVFRQLMDDPELNGIEAGVALQAYLPDSLAAMQSLMTWGSQKAGSVEAGHSRSPLKVRLVKGANLAMERVEAALRGWPQAPYLSKAETDANYKRCLDWALTPERAGCARIGVASHNLFDIAWADLLATRRGVRHMVKFEMIEGMAPTQARLLRNSGQDVLLYLPAVAEQDFDVAISYLFRRLEENASSENFVHHLRCIRSNRAEFEKEAAKFRASVANRWSVGSGPRRQQDRRKPPVAVDPGSDFANEPDTDPALAANREWAREVLERVPLGPKAPVACSVHQVDRIVAAAVNGQRLWVQRPPADRRELLWRVADEMSRRRGDLVAAMVGEGGKTLGQADPEVSEAVDFARWYGDHAVALSRSEAARFDPLGVVLVASPWNFPVAIPAGGVFAALAAGNACILKPAPETPACAELVAQCCWAAGVPRELLQFIRTPDDEIGRYLVTHPGVDAVILTGAYETAEKFLSWRPGLRLLAETSGNNALVITPSADIDLAVADLVASAFGHSGQKCSAASLAICVADAYESPRLRRQLADAVKSLEVGPSSQIGAMMGPIIGEARGKLRRALTELDSGEEWLVEPRQLDSRLWTPGVRLGVAPGSWFAQTECFGPVLGLMAAESLDHAITLQNSTAFGLTGGIHSLDPAEIKRWTDATEVGNAYVNRSITGAIVGRQPFGGWKRSSVGPGAKAGGPNYVAQLGTWIPHDDGLTDDQWLGLAQASDEAAWRAVFSVDHDPAGLFCESNIFRYRPLDRVVLRVEADAAARDVERVRAAALRCGAELIESTAARETGAELAARLGTIGGQRLRVVGTCGGDLRVAAHLAGLHVADDPVTRDGRIELLHYLREQTVSQTIHRYGSVL